MELPTGSTENKSGHRLSRAIYGGHISGRRLQGVKMNPIYQEHNSIFWDNQPNANIPDSDFQIKTYESLPGRHFMRPSSSAPNIPHACSTSMSRIPYVCNGLMSHLGEIEQQEATLHFSDFFLPGRMDGGSTNSEGSDVQTSSDTRDSHTRTLDRAHPWSWPHSDRGYRKKLIRQQGIDVASNDFKNTETSNSLMPTSISPARRSAPSISNLQFSQIKRRRIPRILKQTTFLRKTKLSVLREQSTSTETEHSGVSENEHHDVSDIEQNNVDANEQCRQRDTTNETPLTNGENDEFSISDLEKNESMERQGF